MFLKVKKSSSDTYFFNFYFPIHLQFMKTLENKIIVSKEKEKKVKQEKNKQILPKFSSSSKFKFRRQIQQKERAS